MFWPGSRWVIRQFWSLVLNLRTELLLCCIFCHSGIDYWGSLMFVCIGCTRNPVDIPPGHFVMFFPHLNLIANWLGLAWVVLWSWLPLYSVGVMWNAPFPLQFSIGLIRHLLLLSTHSIPLFLSGDDDRNPSTKILSLFLLLWDQAMCKWPSVFLTNLHLSMIITHFHRIRIPMSLLRFPSEQAKVRIATAVTWACPSFLLSLLLVNLYAQIHDATSYCVCWHLITSQFGWDEVKGLCPLVYEDTLSETCLLYTSDAADE